MKKLTNREEEIMHILWQINKGFVRDVLAKIPDPKPSYNTVSTIIRILEKKGYIGHESFGPTHRYYPLMAKDEYTKNYLHTIVQDYFSNSYQQLVSFFAREKKLSIKDLEEIVEMIRKEKP